VDLRLRRMASYNNTRAAVSEREADEIAAQMFEGLCKKEWGNFIATMCGLPGDPTMPTCNADVHTGPITPSKGEICASMLWHPSKDSCEMSVTVGSPSDKDLVEIGNSVTKRLKEVASSNIPSKTSLHLVGGSGQTQMGVYATNDSRFFCTVLVYQQKLIGAPPSLVPAGGAVKWHACKVTMSAKIWSNGDIRIRDRLESIKQRFGHDYMKDLEQLKDEGFTAACYALGEYVRDDSDDVGQGNEDEDY